MSRVRVKALKAFSSTVFGAVAAGEYFDLDSGYVKDMVVWGMIEDPAPSFTVAAKDVQPVESRTFEPTLVVKPTEPPAPLIVAGEPVLEVGRVFLGGQDVTDRLDTFPAVDPATAALEAAIAAAPVRRGRPKGSRKK